MELIALARCLEMGRTESGSHLRLEVGSSRRKSSFPGNHTAEALRFLRAY